MSGASPLAAIAEHVSGLRDEVVRRCGELHGCEEPGARSERANLREALRLLSAAEDRIRMCGAGTTIPAAAAATP